MGAGSKAGALPADFLAGANGCVGYAAPCYAAIDTLRIMASIIASASSL
jgi:hypothetical protein